MLTISSTGTPEIEAGRFISSELRSHVHSNVLLLFSSGSSLDILKYIDTDMLGSHITVIMVDERYTTDPEGSNYRQLTQQEFYAKALEREVTVIDTTVIEGETHEGFAERIHSTLDTYLQTHKNVYILGILGIGNNGHTASIFPNSKKIFGGQYDSKNYYVPVTDENREYPLRISITPNFITEKIDTVLLYAKRKQEMLLMAKSFSQIHDFPARLALHHKNCFLFTDAEITGF